MSLQSKPFDFWYAVHNTKIVRGPSRALETFGATRINYHHLAELPDDPRKIRIREASQFTAGRIPVFQSSISLRFAATEMLPLQTARIGIPFPIFGQHELLTT